MTTVLIADDNAQIVSILEEYSKKEGYRTLTAADGEQALQLFRQEGPDVVLLDVMMPKLDGFAVCREIRRESDTPVIMVTARGEDFERIMGLDIGADDYIVKPFSPREVIARIKALFRRIQDTESGQKPSILRFDGLEINLDNYQVKVKDEVVAFTPKEVEILYLLASHAGQVMDREQILSKVWGYDYFGDTRTVDTHIKRIRQKIDSDHPKYGLITVYGVGYKFEATS